MPPRGVKKGTKRARQYEHVKKSEKHAGRSEERAEEIAARTVNKEKARLGRVADEVAKLDPRQVVRAARRSALRQRRRRSHQASSSTTTPRSSTSSGRSKMSKQQLLAAVNRKGG